jgi:hypothetical protein
MNMAVFINIPICITHISTESKAINVHIPAKGRCTGCTLYCELMEATAFWSVKMWFSSSLERFPKIFIAKFQQFFLHFILYHCRKKPNRIRIEQFCTGFSGNKLFYCIMHLVDPIRMLQNKKISP